MIHCPTLGGSAREQAKHGLVRVNDSVGGTIREVLEPCVQVGKIVVGMFFGLSPACAGQSFDGKHELLSGGDAQGRSAPLTWVKTTESPWDHAMHSVPGGIALHGTLHVVDTYWSPRERAWASDISNMRTPAKHKVFSTS